MKNVRMMKRVYVVPLTLRASTTVLLAVLRSVQDVPPWPAISIALAAISNSVSVILVRQMIFAVCVVAFSFKICMIVIQEMVHHCSTRLMRMKITCNVVLLFSSLN